MDIDASRCLDALKTLAIACFDGEVRASPYTVAALASGAPIVAECLALDPSRIALPFLAADVDAAMVIAHAPNLEVRAADPPFGLGDVDAMRRVADVFDYLGATVHQDFVIGLALPAYRRLPLEAKGGFMDTVFRHSDEKMWGKFIHSALADTPFWTVFKRIFLDNIRSISPRATRKLVDSLDAVFPPVWVMEAACRRMRESLDVLGVLEVAGAPYADRTHPPELHTIAAAAVGTFDRGRGEGPLPGLVISVLKNASAVTDPGLSSPVHGGDRGVAGNIAVFEDGVSVLVGTRALAPRTRTPRKRTVHKHVSITSSEAGFKVSVDVGALCGARNVGYVACRMAISSGGSCEAEEWFFEDGGPTGAGRYSFESGSGFTPPGSAPIVRAAEFDLACSLRVDLFFNDRSYEYFYNSLAVGDSSRM
jgi:hypothetical protein